MNLFKNFIASPQDITKIKTSKTNNTSFLIDFYFYANKCANKHCFFFLNLKINQRDILICLIN